MSNLSICSKGRSDCPYYYDQFCERGELCLFNSCAYCIYRDYVEPCFGEREFWSCSCLKSPRFHKVTTELFSCSFFKSNSYLDFSGQK